MPYKSPRPKGRKTNEEKNKRKFRSFAYISPKGWEIAKISKKKGKIYFRKKK